MRAHAGLDRLLWRATVVAAFCLASSVSACRDRSTEDPTPSVAASAAASAAAKAADPPPDGSPAIAIVHGDTRHIVTSRTLATRPTKLVATNRRAWLVSEIVGTDYASPGTSVSAVTTEGERYLLRGEGTTRKDRPILVRRTNGELYVGWLATDDLPLADAEQPAERVEHVASVNLEKAEPLDETPASLTVVVNGETLTTLTPSDFAKAARSSVRTDRDDAAPAIDVERAFAGTTHLAGGTARDEAATFSRPQPDARPVVTMNRRKHFKLQWVDATGRRIDGANVRDVSRLELTRSTAGR